jgi:hypothetical protein
MSLMRSHTLPMIALLLGGTGCLEPHGAYLAKMDELPPTVVSSSPVPLTGAAPAVALAERFLVTFSELMEPRSLRGGIQLFQGTSQVALTLTLPTPDPLEDGIDRGDQPYEVGFAPTSGVLQANRRHTVVYSTVITDTEGNALANEVRISFMTQP